MRVRPGARGRVTGEHGMPLCGQRLLWRHCSPSGQGLGKGLLPQLNPYNGAHPLLVRTLVKHRKEAGEIGWAASRASHLRCPTLTLMAAVSRVKCGESAPMRSRAWVVVPLTRARISAWVPSRLRRVGVDPRVQ